MARRGHHTLEEIKDMVLTAAEELVVKGGLTQLRVRNIAMKIGYTVGSIYMVFDNMNDLILQLKGKILDEIVEGMKQIHAETSQQRLAEMASFYIKYANLNLNRWNMVFEHRLPDNAETPESYQKKLDNLYGQFTDQFALLSPELNQAQHRQVALAFLSGLHGICVFMLTTPINGLANHDWDESVALLIRRFIHDGHMNSISETTSPNNTNAQAWDGSPPVFSA